MNLILRRALLAVVVALGGLCVGGRPAAAVVSVDPTSAAAGTVIDLRVTVSNERTGVDMTQLEIVFPVAAMPLRANAAQHHGWSASVDSSTGRVGTVTWSQGAMGPGASEIFVLTLTLPDSAPSMGLTVAQQYSDGTVDRWGSDSSHHLAALTLTGSKPTSSSTTAPTVTTTSVVEDDNGDSSAASGNKRIGKLLIGVGLAVSVLVVARARTSARSKKRRAALEAEAKKAERAGETGSRRRRS